MAQINFRLDDGVKSKAETLFLSLGMNMSTAITVFIRQSIAENGIPFRIQATPVSDRERFIQAGEDYENGRINYHYHELPSGKRLKREKGVCREKTLA